MSHELLLWKLLDLERPLELTSDWQTFCKDPEIFVQVRCHTDVQSQKTHGDHCSGGRPSPSPFAFPQESREMRQNLQGLQNTFRTPLWDIEERVEVHRGKLICSRSLSKLAWDLGMRQWPAAAGPNNWIIELKSTQCFLWVGTVLGVCSGIIYSPDTPCGVIFTTISQMKRWSLPHLGITFQGAVVSCWAQETYTVLKTYCSSYMNTSLHLCAL